MVIIHGLDKNISNFQEMDIPEYMMKLEHLDILGMFYDIVEKHMLRNGFGSCGRAKYYDKNRYSFKNDLYIYDAVKISISYVENNIIMNLLPTVHVLHKNGKELERFDYQAVVNREMSLLYNRQTDEKIESWVQKLSVEGRSR